MVQILPVLFGLVLILGGCGETPDNTPLAGDIEGIGIEANATRILATEQAAVEATVYYTLDVPDRNVTENVEWTSSNTSIATVSADGIVSGAGEGGVVSIKAEYKRFDASTDIEVIALRSLEIVADDANLSQERYVPLHCEGTFEDESRRDVTGAVTWLLVASGESNASIDANGTLYTGDADGSLVVRAERFDVNTTRTFTVTP